MASFSNHVDEFIYNFNRNYELKHKSYEDNFWATKMNLAGCSSHELAKTKSELDQFLGDKQMLQQVRELQSSAEMTEEQKKILACFEKTLLCYIIEDPAAIALKERINELEATLAEHRNRMQLGYTAPDGSFVKASSVQLRNLMRNSDDEAVRAACLEGLRSIGTFVAEGFCEIVKLRNQLAKGLGFECFYDMKVTQAEGFNKKVLFDVLDKLERDTKPILEAALRRLASEKGEAALLPHNTGFMMAGDISRLKDPYFPFEDAVDVWARSFAALNISYRGSTMRLDLCDRDGKYSNGFCHWPQPAWRTQTGEWVPSQTNFTSLASPKSIGSGNTALVTLMHEGGHAAHFANVDQGSPLFSQERAPTSVAYAENQSMFLDSIVSDADWMGRYALSRSGEPIPWSIIEQDIRATHPYEVFALRAMLAVPYFEKRLYELADDEVTPERIIRLAEETEVDIQGTRAGRPLMSVPHILADESAAYYHGYVLAEMSVHQTRKYFESKYGYIVDNPNVGKDLAEVYWKPGNSAAFLDLVEKLTGSPLSADAWVHKLQEDTEAVVASEHAAYEKAVKEGPKYPRGSNVDLDMRVLLVHGDEVISDSSQSGFAGACAVYKEWVAKLA
jgi:Zn-dependent oligopeptidase